MIEEKKQLAPFTQGEVYGSWQEAMGREIKNISLSDGDNWLIGQAIKYPLPLGKSYWYIPHGPLVVGELTENLLKEFQKFSQKLLKEKNSIFLRFDPFPNQTNNEKYWQKYFKLAPRESNKSSYIQSTHDWRLDLTKSEEDLLKAMHEKGRYGISVARRREVVVEKVVGQDIAPYFNDFYRLMSETAERNHFRLHPIKYYEAIWESAKSNNDLALFIARYQDKILAMHLIYFYGNTAYYPFGASANIEKERTPTYLLHWEAIREAKRLGYHWYNFGAVETEDNKTGHSWAGLSAFKKRFGGEILNYSPLYDLVGQPFWYWLYNLRRKLKK